MSAAVKLPARDITIKSLAEASIWCAWQSEIVDGRVTKVPYSTRGVGQASTTKADTWGTRAQAEARAAGLAKPLGVGGVGLILGTTIGDGLSLGGIDLDTCRDKVGGSMEEWAVDVISLLGSYTEVSPSLTGAKVFFAYKTADLDTIRKSMNGAEWGKKFERGGGEHPPAIEVYFGARYFAVTDQCLAAWFRDINPVETDTIVELIIEVGPNFKKVAPPEKAEKNKRTAIGNLDRSRSSTAFAIGKRARVEGATFDEMCAAIQQDERTASWYAEKGLSHDKRELRRIWDKSEPNGSLIRVIAGQLHTAATAGEDALIQSALPIFQRGNALVRPIVQDVPAARGRMTVSAALHEIDTHGLVDALCGCATWEKYDGRAEDWVRINPPTNVAETILSRSGLWRLPKIVGVTTPTIRPDGSILSAPGYDAATRLYHAADPALVLSAAAHNPTRDTALKALDLLNGLLAEFPFVTDVSRAVALSGLITPVVRGALAVAPLHAFRANTAGTGKSYLVDLASAISSGRPCPVVAAGSDEAETEKRLAGLLLAGFPIVSLDNVNGELGGDLLCQAIERPFIRLRPLGRSDIIEIESRATINATGNGLRVRGDMVRRSIVCDLDAGMERPELRPFKGDPVATVMGNRGRYVSSCIAIVRAYIVAGCPNRLAPIASFEDWSGAVRSALVWLGCSDPAESMEQAREDDPELAELLEVMTAWRGALGTTEAFTVKELADAAEARTKTQMGEPTEFAHPGWRDCLLRLAGERGIVNTKRLGRWLMNREGRIVGRSRIKRAGQGHGGLWRWALMNV